MEPIENLANEVRDTVSISKKARRKVNRKLKTAKFARFFTFHKESKTIKSDTTPDIYHCQYKPRFYHHGPVVIENNA